MTALKKMGVLPSLLLAGCPASRLQSSGFDSSRFDPAQRLSPTAFEQNATMKDTSVHKDPNLLKVGVSRAAIVQAFGPPNETSDDGSQPHDEYDFNPDGSKFVKPKIYARNIAAGVFTGGLATVAHQARIHHAEQQLTVYHLTYGADGLVDSVKKESRSAPPAEPDATAAAPPS
jgi:hypothetical protein